MHTGTRPFKGIQLTLTAPLRGCGFHVVWVGGIALHRPDWENYNNKKKKTYKNCKMAGDLYIYVCEQKVSMCEFERGEMV